MDTVGWVAFFNPTKPKMAFEYLREYRTYFHISVSYGLSESNAYKIIRWVEDTLIKSKVFSLPGRKALLKSDVEYSVVLVDASESPVQRPKKNRDIITQREFGNSTTFRSPSFPRRRESF